MGARLNYYYPVIILGVAVCDKTAATVVVAHKSK